MEEQRAIKRKAGRPRGSTSTSGVLQTTLIDAVEYVKEAYNAYGQKTASYDEMRNSMGLKHGAAIKAFGDLIKYRFIEKVGDINWRVTDVGKMVTMGDRGILLEAFNKNPIFVELYNKFGDMENTPDSIKAYIRRKYKKGGNVSVIVEKYLQAVEFVNSFKTNIAMPIKEPIISEPKRMLNVIQLKYALNPPSSKEIGVLVDGVCDDFKNEDAPGVRTIVKQLQHKKEDRETVRMLFEMLIEALSEKYPEIAHDKKVEREAKK